jgi:hypothetical protein
MLEKTVSCDNCDNSLKKQALWLVLDVMAGMFYGSGLAAAINSILKGI